MSKPEVLLDTERLQADDGLSPQENEAIQSKVFSEMTKSKTSEKKEVKEEEYEDPFKADLSEKNTDKPKKKDEKAEDDAPNKEEEQDSESLKAEESAKADSAKAEEVKKADEEKLKNLESAKAKKDEDRTEDEKTLVRAHEEQAANIRKEDLQKEAKQYALDNGISEKAAQEQVEHFSKVREKFSGDPKEMSKAIYHLHSKFTQVSQELSAIKNAPKEGEIVFNGKKLSKEETRELFIQKYREGNPELSEDLDDDKVYILAKKGYDERVEMLTSQKVQDLQGRAEKARQSVIDSLPAEDKKFSKHVGIALSRVSPDELADPNFDPSDYVWWARGQFYHSDMADAEKRGYERATKEKKILGKSAENTSGGGSQPAKGGSSTGLTPDEKESALDMYRSSQISDDEKFKMYTDFKQGRKR